MTYPVKACLPIGLWSWGPARVKAYVLARDPTTVGRDVVESARTALEAAEDIPTADDELGFAIVHRCATENLLLACTWRAENELWETVWSDSSGTFAPVDRGTGHLPTYCVWEMGVVTHETRAWRRVLSEGRTAGAMEAYLADTLAGEV